MNYEEFLNHAAAWLQSYFDAHPQGPGAGIRTGIRDVEKLQGESYRGLTLGYPSSRVGASINPGPFFEMYRKGLPLETALQRLLEHVLPILECPAWSDSPLSFAYEDCRDRLMLELISIKGNEDQLRSLPWRQIADLALIVRVDFGGTGDSRASAVVNDSLLANFGVSPDKLFEDALAAASGSIPLTIRPMSEILTEISSPAFAWGAGSHIPLYVATNSRGFMGASVLAYPEFGPEASRLLQDDFYIIPSSIHEVLLLPAGHFPCIPILPAIVKSVNLEQVAPEDRLSDNVYFYSRSLGRIVYALVPGDPDHKNTACGQMPADSSQSSKDPGSQDPLILF
jgi:hypothetical protein